jgi:ABC-type transport system substrate-binding protein
MARMGRRDALAGLAGGILGRRAAYAQTPTQGGTLTVGLANDAKTYDPIFSVQYTERYVLYLAFDTLVEYAPDFSIKPGLAESWETSADGKRIVFTLRQGVKFQDGTEFDAAAVKWNIDQRLDEKVNSPQRQVLAPIVASVEVIDPRHVAFNLLAPSPVLFSLKAETMIQPNSMLDDLGRKAEAAVRIGRGCHGEEAATPTRLRQPDNAYRRDTAPATLAISACRRPMIQWTSQPGSKPISVAPGMSLIHATIRQ